MGNRNHTLLKPHAHREDLHQALKDELAKPSLYDTVLRMLADNGYDVPNEVLTRDVSQKLPHTAGVEDVWRQIYQDPNTHWEYYELAGLDQPLQTTPVQTRHFQEYPTFVS